jgi:diguanylate cyclase (GGDEF)-like protein
MEASSLTRRVLKHAVVRDWAWWQLPGVLRGYVAAVPLTALAIIAFAASQTAWHWPDLWKYLLLLSCGMVSVAATPRVAYQKPGLSRDFLTAWVLPVAILLPPVYAMVTPIPLQILHQWRVHKGIVFRRVFTAGAISLTFGAASLLFRTFPASFAGPAVGSGPHALTWVLAVLVAEIAGDRGHQLLIMAAVKLSDPAVKLADMVNREALMADFAETDLSVLNTIVIGVNPVLAIVAAPTVLLARRFIMHAQLLAASRVDTKTGLLNASTWEQEAEVEIARAIRLHTPLAVALVDIDHFKAVNDTHGHLVGDKALRAVTDALQTQLRVYDLAGRFGGEEFAILLPQAREVDALTVAERLRSHIAAMSIPVDDDDPAGPCVKLTISVGVASLDGESRELTDLLAAADAALYYAKETGRNRTHVVPASAHVS